jgi:DNA-directed RNA polymerase subunit RPC12/RpoP
VNHPGLAAVIEAWNRLAEAMLVGIVAMGRSREKLKNWIANLLCIGVIQSSTWIEPHSSTRRFGKVRISPEVDAAPKARGRWYMSNLLHNAILSINVGLEDFEVSGRILSSIRNVHAGILLLFKEKLLRLSPPGSEEALIKADIEPKRDANGGGNVLFVGVGKRTVDMRQIKKRFKSLGIIADWKRFEKVTELRNNVEHYYSSDPPSTMKEVLANSFIIIRDFIVNELEDDPRVLLGEEKWKVLLSVAEVFEKERADCVALLNSVDWQSDSLKAALLEYSCAKCDSSLIAPDNTNVAYSEVAFQCRSCGERILFSDAIEKMLEHFFFGELYLAASEGGEPPLYQCDECMLDSFVVEEHRCVACGAELVYSSCDVCGNQLGPDEQGNRGLCHYHSHLMSKRRTDSEGDENGTPFEAGFDLDASIEF